MDYDKSKIRAGYSNTDISMIVIADMEAEMCCVLYYTVAPCY